MLNATWLDTFTTLAEIGHFTRAAQRLNMTQPGVSQHLRKLEAQLGQPLIAQDGKQFTLTPAGEAVFKLGLARRQEEAALRDTMAEDAWDAGQVRLACSGSFATLIYPHVLDILSGAPNLRVDVVAAPQDSVRAGVIDGRFDLGLLSQDPTHPRLAATALGQEELCLVIPADDPLDRVDLDALQQRGFVAHPDGYAYADELFSLNFPERYRGADRLRVRTEVNQIGQILVPVARGIGYTVVPRSAVTGFAQRDALAVQPLPRPLHHEVWLVQRKGRALSARVARVAALASDVARGLSAS